MIKETREFYSGVMLDGREIRGMLAWFGRTPAVRGWVFEDVSKFGAEAWGYYEVKRKSLRPLSEEEIAQLRLDERKAFDSVLSRH
ncbi:MAG: hypothetical protein IKO05_12375 [Selenomonadaceae bacterium]|nr:hypothetical protein [Selenomonadaceae bacterium]